LKRLRDVAEDVVSTGSHYNKGDDMINRKKDRVSLALTVLGSALAALGSVEQVHAASLTSGGGWDLSLDTTLQYNIGVRAQRRNDLLGNNPAYAEGDYKFDRGDLVTNRVQGLFELQGAYKKDSGFHLSGSAWKDFAYDNEVKTNPNPAFSSFLSYPGGRYSSTTERWHLRGAEILDAFVYHNTKAGNVPVYLKIGRFTQQWGNAMFFGFSNIAYSQHPTDFIKGFTQPGTEVKELFLPRKQIMATADLTPELSVSGQYFLEFRPNRFPEGGTYLGPADFLYEGPTSGGILAGAFGGPVTAGRSQEPKNRNGNYGVKVAWSPNWAGGDMGFYYRKLDDVQPWALVDINKAGGGALHLNYAQGTNLYGFSYERKIGWVSTGFEVSYRTHSGLPSALANGLPGTPYNEGATGNIVNVIANGLVILPRSPLWDTGTLIGELSYTRLAKVTGNPSLFNGVGYAACTNSLNPALPGSKEDGCVTKNALALAVLFEPQWIQAIPSVDLSLPMSLTAGLNGLPAYTGGSFYAQGAKLFSIGIKANYKQSTTLSLAYNAYHYNTRPAVDIPGLGASYSGGAGAIALNDKGWVQLVLKTSF
jgi:hypothetical protein